MRDEYAVTVADMVSAKLGDTDLPDAAPEREAAPAQVAEAVGGQGDPEAVHSGGAGQ
jgi:hypothetical protein